MKFNKNDEMALWMTLVDIFGEKNLIMECIPNMYFAFAIRRNFGAWELYELVGKGGKVVKCKGAYCGYKIESGVDKWQAIES